ncbi:hypothetical protein [Amycolatopsis sp. cmx-4-68]|uniref:hypothetical protein n=1 Tax=Amycolatopsis sp. cmx-4-68 TaxID=2790938 RepID=UPI00397E4699
MIALPALSGSSSISQPTSAKAASTIRRYCSTAWRNPSRNGESGEARAVGTVHQALLSGVMLQWLIDPDRALSDADLVRGLRLIATAVLT